MNRTEHLLACLAEECNEVAQACMKAQRFGLQDGYPGANTTNAEDISRELTDLIAVMLMLVDDLSIQRPTLDGLAIVLKQQKVEKFMRYAESTGVLTPTPPSAGDGEPVAWRWRTFPRFREDGDSDEWSLIASVPDFINAHHHEVEPLYTKPAPAEGLREASSSIEYQQKRGVAWDIIDEALLAYSDYMLDDDFNAQRALDKIMQRMDTRRAFYNDGKSVLSALSHPSTGERS